MRRIIVSTFLWNAPWPGHDHFLTPHKSGDFIGTILMISRRFIRSSIRPWTRGGVYEHAGTGVAIRKRVFKDSRR